MLVLLRDDLQRGAGLEENAIVQWAHGKREMRAQKRIKESELNYQAGAKKAAINNFGLWLTGPFAGCRDLLSEAFSLEAVDESVGTHRNTSSISGSPNVEGLPRTTRLI